MLIYLLTFWRTALDIMDTWNKITPVQKKQKTELHKNIS